MKNKRKSISREIKEMNKPVRLNKYIADSGYCSRRKADDIIAQGRVAVNKRKISKLGTKVKQSDLVTIDGDPVSPYSKKTYILLNKPKDVITTTSDEKGRRTVMDIVNRRTRVYPVGRLDRNTTGTLLITNDGELAARLTHPKYKIRKIYSARLDKPLTDDDAHKLTEGIELDDGMAAAFGILISPGDRNKVIVTMIEGRNREVRRLFEAVGYEVKQLDRKYFANLSVKGLNRGRWRNLHAKELQNLKKLVGLK